MKPTCLPRDRLVVISGADSTVPVGMVEFE